MYYFKLDKQMCRHTCPLIWLLEELLQKAKIVLDLDVKSYDCVLTAKVLLISLQAYYLIYILLHLVSEASISDRVNSNQRVSNLSNS